MYLCRFALALPWLLGAYQFMDLGVHLTARFVTWPHLSANLVMITYAMYACGCYGLPIEERTVELVGIISTAVYIGFMMLLFLLFDSILEQYVDQVTLNPLLCGSSHLPYFVVPTVCLAFGSIFTARHAFKYTPEMKQSTLH